jgi:HEAT repeat protein
MAAAATLALLGAGCDEGPKHNGRSMSSWMRDLDAQQAYQRRAAAQAMGALGPAAAGSIPQLIVMLSDEDGTVQFEAAEALAKMGDRAVPPLEALLKEIDPELRLHATVTLLQINPAHAAAQDKLVESLTGVGQPALAKRAQERAIRLGALFVPKLIPLLDDPYLPLRLQVVRTLTGMKKEAVAALPKLIELGKTEKNVEVRREIVSALGRIGTKETVEAPLRAFTDDTDAGVIAAANSMLRYIGATGEVVAGEAPAVEARRKADENAPLESLLSE